MILHSLTSNNAIKTVLVLDDSNDVALAITRLTNFEVVGLAMDEIEAHSLINRKKPDIILINVSAFGDSMPGILEHLNKNHMYTPSIFTAPMRDFYKLASLLRAMDQHGFAICAVDINENVRLNWSVGMDALPDINNEIMDVLINLGIPATCKGMTCLTIAIAGIFNDSELSECYSKRLYPYVAQKMCKGWKAVEKSIRQSIIACKERKTVLFTSLFHNIPDEKISNTAFIGMVVHYIRSGKHVKPR